MPCARPSRPRRRRRRSRGGQGTVAGVSRASRLFFLAQDCRGRVAGVPCLPGGEEVIGSGVSSHSACGAVRRPLLLPACDRRACAPARSIFAPGEEARAESATAGWCARSGTAAPVASPPRSRSWRACAESVGVRGSSDDARCAAGRSAAATALRGAVFPGSGRVGLGAPVQSPQGPGRARRAACAPVHARVHAPEVAVAACFIISLRSDQPTGPFRYPSRWPRRSPAAPEKEPSQSAWGL